jgi:plasmid stabilization system protein ParE
MAQVIWTKKASGQFERAVKYIYKEQGFYYADIVREKILQTTALLEGQPQMWTIEPLLSHKKFDYRFLLVWSYKIIYRTTEDKVMISRVFHTSRSPKKLKGI